MGHVLRIRARRWRRHDGQETCHLTVFCPRRSQTIALSLCVDCPKASGIRAGLADPDRHLVCRAARPPQPGSPLARHVHEVMQGDVLAVSLDTPAYEVREMLLEGSVDLALVADDDGTVAGAVTKTDLLRAGRLAEWATPAVFSWRDLLPWRRDERHRAPDEGMCAADVMNTTPSVIEETMSIGAALERFLRERIRVLPVVSTSGALVGILDVADALAACLPDDAASPPPLRKRA